MHVERRSRRLMALFNKLTGRYLPTALMLAVMVACIVAVWLRNHDVLRDLNDYSMVITAAGKLEAGLKPYSDVRTPVQSAVYLLNYGTEKVFGRNYLALTLGGLIQAIGGALLVRGLLRPALGGMAATLVALAVSLAGLIQHMVFFYNPVGILCLSVVWLSLAIEPALWPVRSWKTVAIYAALFVGGINKLNFHGAAMVGAGLLLLAAGTSRRMTPGAVFRDLLLLVLLGCVLPLAFELAWTGATFSQWLENVVLLPSERHGYLRLALAPQIYLRPEHDFYHHIPIRAIGGIGLGLLLVTGGWLMADARTNRRPAADWILRLLLVIAGAGLAALLMVTNHETIMLTSLAYPVLALALFLRFRGSGRPVERGMERLILAAMVVWAATGGYAAWHGSRVLYGQDPPPWSDYGRFHPQARALAYFDGVKMTSDQIAALQMVAAKLKTLEGPDGRLDGMLFGSALEWLERAYPESITRNAPIGYMGGITLREGDADYMKDVCLVHGTRRLIAQKGWQSWPPSVWGMLERDYRREEVGSRDVMYHPRGPSPAPVEALPPDIPPRDYRDKVAGNILITSTRASAGLGLRSGAGGRIYGASQSTNWSWPLGTNDFQGWAVAQLGSGRDRAGVVIFRIVEGDPDTGVVWETPVTVSPAQREVAVPIALVAGGRPVWLQTFMREEDRGTLTGGWRGMRISRSNDSDQSPAPPFDSQLRRVPPGAGEKPGDDLWYASAPAALLPDGWVRLPAENWRRAEPRPGLVRIRVDFTPDLADPADQVVLALGWYRASRFEIMTERAFDLRTTRSVTMEAWVTEPGGWVGLLARCFAKDHRMRITAWERPPAP